MKIANEKLLRSIAWLLWAYLFGSLFFYRAFFDPGAIDPDAGFGIFEGAILFLPSAICLILRWRIIPRIKTLNARLVLMIVGASIGEVITFYGLFLAPHLDNYFFGISLIMVFQFMPTYFHQRKS